MPSIRDLKGRPVDEIIDSRTLPGLPDPGQQMAERDAVRQAVEKLTATRGRFTPPDDNFSQHSGVESFERATLDPESSTLHFGSSLPEDMAQALAALETTATELHIQVTDGVRLLREQTAAIRARAEKDAAKLAKLAEMLKALGE